MNKQLLKLFLLLNFVATAQVAHKKVIAKKGEGVYSLLRKHQLNPSKYYKAFLSLNEKALYKGHGLYSGKTYLLPPKTALLDSTKTIVNPIKPEQVNNDLIKNKNYPIFGKQHEVVILKNQNLKDAVFYLVSGHGGPDPGAITTYNNTLISEDEYAYDVTLRLAKRLLSQGAQVYIIIRDPNDGIRDKSILKVDYDETNYSGNPIHKKQVIRLQERTKEINRLFYKHKGKHQRLVVTHIDSRSKGKNIDVFFYHHKSSKKGKQLAEQMHRVFSNKYAKYQPNRTYSGTVGSRNLYLVNKTLPPMVYIELGNIRNAKDQKRILNYENREALANWISLGLLADYKN